MSSIGPKLPRLRLDPISSESLRQQVLRRDGWRCQLCGSMSNLEVHHKQFRSHSGDDSKENLVTVCDACHSALHRGECSKSILRQIRRYYDCGSSKGLNLNR